MVCIADGIERVVRLVPRNRAESAEAHIDHLAAAAMRAMRLHTRSLLQRRWRRRRWNIFRCMAKGLCRPNCDRGVQSIVEVLWSWLSHIAALTCVRIVIKVDAWVRKQVLLACTRLAGGAALAVGHCIIIVAIALRNAILHHKQVVAPMIAWIQTTSQPAPQWMSGGSLTLATATATLRPRIPNKSPKTLLERLH